MLAAIVGAAVGWLTNGYRNSSRESSTRNKLMQQSLALSQAETDSRMIEEDYQDLKMRSEELIAQLRDENRRVPQLQQNLDESQTLVRQMMQKHDAELSHLQHQNEVLARKLRELEGREAAIRTLQHSYSPAGPAHTGKPAVGSNSVDRLPAEPPARAGADTSGVDASSESLVMRVPGKDSPATGKTAARPEPVKTTSTEEATAQNRATEESAKSNATQIVKTGNRGESDDTRSSDTPSADTRPSDLRSEDTAGKSGAVYTPPTLSVTSRVVSGKTRQSAPHDSRPPDSAAPDRQGTAQAGAETDSIEVAAPATGSPTEEPEPGHDSPDSPDKLKQDLQDLHEALSGGGTENRKPSRKKAGNDASRTRSTTINRESEEPPRFTPAANADDLKKVYGIGPKTERALTDMGINTISQVANLTRPDIEFIAARMNIFPGKIEKDNWVASAREILAESAALQSYQARQEPKTSSENPPRPLYEPLENTSEQ